MSTYFQYQFWAWRENFKAVLVILSDFVDYSFDESDWEAIEVGLRYTNDEENNWYDYVLQGPNYEIELIMAKDAESDLVHLKLNSFEHLRVKVETLDQIQSRVKRLEV